jgi:hypothetical protein
LDVNGLYLASRLLTKSAKYYFDYYAILEPAAYDGRKDTAFKGSDKYAEGTTGLNVQTFASKGHERWPNKIRGFVEKKDKPDYLPATTVVAYQPILPATSAMFGRYAPKPKKKAISSYSRARLSLIASKRVALKMG